LPAAVCDWCGVSLTLGAGPLGNRPAGIYNRELPGWEGLLYLEPSPRRIRGRAGGEMVVDSVHTRMLYEHGRLPIYMFPRQDVRTELLLPSERQTDSRFSLQQKRERLDRSTRAATKEVSASWRTGARAVLHRPGESRPANAARPAPSGPPR
jgi:hypothetical protein